MATKPNKTRHKFRVWTTVTVTARAGFSTRTETRRTHPVTVEAEDFASAIRIVKRREGEPS